MATEPEVKKANVPTAAQVAAEQNRRAVFAAQNPGVAFPEGEPEYDDRPVHTSVQDTKDLALAPGEKIRYVFNAHNLNFGAGHSVVVTSSDPEVVRVAPDAVASGYASGLTCCR
jgi:hypothetical protein